jgi:hypothetical protein
MRQVELRTCDSWKRTHASSRGSKSTFPPAVPPSVLRHNRLPHAFGDFVIGSLPAATGRKMHFTGTTVLRIKNGKIAEEVGLDDVVTALNQLGLIRAL